MHVGCWFTGDDLFCKIFILVSCNTQTWQHKSANVIKKTCLILSWLALHLPQIQYTDLNVMLMLE